MKITEQELEKRDMALENAIASHRLEGLEPDIQTIEDLTVLSVVSLALKNL